MANTTKSTSPKTAAPKAAAKPAVKTEKSTTGRLVIIRLRGIEGVNGKIADTMTMLKLPKKHACSIYNNTPQVRGMMEKCKDYATFGELDDETYKLLVEKRGITAENNTCHLNSPKGGFERNGIKVPYTLKGALGYRGADINKLVKRML